MYNPHSFSQVIGHLTIPRFINRIVLTACMCKQISRYLNLVWSILMINLLKFTKVCFNPQSLWEA